MKINKLVFLALAIFSFDSLKANTIEEVVVMSSIISKSASEIADPIHIVSGDDISTEATQSLGETVDDLLGVSTADYGSAVGQPIIRGMSGNRVKVLNNGLVVRDVAFMGADHPIEVDIGGIQQIEIVKGPSSILYSNGAIGGIVNIVDNTIAKEDVLENVFNLGFESQSVNDGDNFNIDYSGSIEGLNLFFSHSSKNLDNFDIPDEAVIHEPGETHDEFSYLPNSDSKLAATRLGISKTGDWGYYGISSVIIDQLNGVPFHGEEEEEEGEEHEDERIFAVTDSSVINIEGEYLLNGAINSIAYSLRETDSSLTEQHYEDPNEVHDPNEPEEHGATTFTNNSEEAQVILDISNANNEQKLVFNLANSDSSVVKEVGTPSMRPAETSESTIGYFFGTNFNDLHMDLGIRFDQINVKGSLLNNSVVTNHDLDFDNLSFSASLNGSLSNNFEATLGVSNVERAPSSVELLMNGKHMAIQRHEVGSVALDSEVANNIDLELSYKLNDIKFNLLYFQNDIDNYIYLLDDANGTKIDGVVIARHSQKDAEFDGHEFSISSNFDLYDGNLAVLIGTDSVDGKFTDGTNIPRITPSRNIYSFVYTQDDVSVDLSLKEVKSQNDTAAGEEGTAGFELLDLMVSKSYSIYSDDDLTLSLFGTNLFNEIARNHASYVKNEVPLAGRNLGLRFNLSL